MKRFASVSVGKTIECVNTLFLDEGWDMLSCTVTKSMILYGRKNKMREATVTEPISIFYCYARKDKILRNEIEKRLTSLKRLGQVISWYDREILPGTDWKREIHRHLDASDIVLLLISPNFIQSDYCYSVEMHRALMQQKAGATSVIPIILRPCNWKELPMSTLQALPEDGRPITTWRNRDEAFQNVVAGIEEVVKRCIAQRSELASKDHSFQNHQKLQVAIEVDGTITAICPLKRQYILIGRVPSADIVINHHSISRSSARIFWERGAWKIMSTTGRGLYYYGELLKPEEIFILVPGDTIWLGPEVRLHVQEEQHD
jgi:hypothetical protein